MGLELRKRKTRRALIAAARALTADVGLAGFTVEELCERVGISRRTFFNYFASKDDAVLGYAIQSPLAELEQEFLDSRDRGESLLTALVDLSAATFREMGDPTSSPAVVFELLIDNPGLLRRLQVISDGRIAEIEELIRRREHREVGDPFQKVAATVFANLAMHAMHTIFDEMAAQECAVSFDPNEELTRRLREGFAILTEIFGAPAAPSTLPNSPDKKETHE